MITGFIRLNGSTVGVVANAQTKLSTNGCRKAARFVNFCDAFEIPVVTYTNVDGFASTEDEEKTVARAAAQLAGAFAAATVPKVNVVVKAVGSAYAVMNAKALGADITIALPGTMIGIMEGQNSSASAAARGYVDQISEAADVRKYVIGALEMLYTKREDSAFIKKHGTV